MGKLSNLLNLKSESDNPNSENRAIMVARFSNLDLITREVEQGRGKQVAYIIRAYFSQDEQNSLFCELKEFRKQDVVETIKKELRNLPKKRRRLLDLIIR